MGYNYTMYVTEKQLKTEISQVNSTIKEAAADLGSDIIALHGQLVSVMTQVAELEARIHNLSIVIESTKNV